MELTVSIYCIAGENFQVLDIIGFLLFAFGFFFEVIADAQKTAFRGNPDNRHKYITTGLFVRSFLRSKAVVHAVLLRLTVTCRAWSGLWARSRHPNYFGEIVMWTGLAVASMSSVTLPVEFLVWLSPVFTVLLLTKVSGVPMLERAGMKKWGGDPKYVAYVLNTPCILPTGPTNKQK